MIGNEMSWDEFEKTYRSYWNHVEMNLRGTTTFDTTFSKDIVTPGWATLGHHQTFYTGFGGHQNIYTESHSSSLVIMINKYSVFGCSTNHTSHETGTVSGLTLTIRINGSSSSIDKIWISMELWTNRSSNTYRSDTYLKNLIIMLYHVKYWAWWKFKLLWPSTIGHMSPIPFIFFNVFF